jgi:type IV pilus assembly protein PilE
MRPDLWTGASHPVALRRRQSGMTLIELMIVVGVLAILASIAVPSYQTYVMKARRADARAALTTAAQMLERYSTENPTTGYSTAKLSNTAGPNVVYRGSSENQHYNIGFVTAAADTAFIVSPVTASAYLMKAIPVGPQAADPCGSFTLRQDGRRGVVGGSLTDAQCW